MKFLILTGCWAIIMTSSVMVNSCAAVQFYRPYNAEAAQQLTVLANRGDADAQNRLGEMYATGQNVKQNSVQAVAWVRKSAGQGNANGQYNLGVMYKTGQGVSQDCAQAVNWIRKAAAQRHALALNNLGWLYAHGQGVPSQPVVAYALYTIAADMDAESGVYAIGNRTALMETMSVNEIDMARHLADEMQGSEFLLRLVDIYIANHVRTPP